MKNKNLSSIVKKLTEIARELNIDETKIDLWEKLNKCIIILQEMQQKEDTFILLRQDFKEQPLEVEGYFNSVRQAKKYIKEMEFCEDDCELHKLAEYKNYL